MSRILLFDGLDCRLVLRGGLGDGFGVLCSGLLVSFSDLLNTTAEFLLVIGLNLAENCSVFGFEN